MRGTFTSCGLREKVAFLLPVIEGTVRSPTISAAVMRARKSQYAFLTGVEKCRFRHPLSADVRMPNHDTRKSRMFLSSVYAVAAALMACAIVNYLVFGQGKYKMTSEEVELYKLSLQQEAKAADAYNKTPEGKAEIRRRFAHDVQSQADQEATEGAQRQKRMARDYRPPVKQEDQCYRPVGSGPNGLIMGMVPCN